jgi:hypothetical protein
MMCEGHIYVTLVKKKHINGKRFPLHFLSIHFTSNILSVCRVLFRVISVYALFQRSVKTLQILRILSICQFHSVHSQYMFNFLPGNLSTC